MSHANAAALRYMRGPQPCGCEVELFRSRAGGSKPAKLETGATIQVPLFIAQGERIKVDTRSDSYVSRATSDSS